MFSNRQETIEIQAIWCLEQIWCPRSHSEWIQDLNQRFVFEQNESFAEVIFVVFLNLAPSFLANHASKHLATAFSRSRGLCTCISSLNPSTTGFLQIQVVNTCSFINDLFSLWNAQQQKFTHGCWTLVAAYLAYKTDLGNFKGAWRAEIHFQSTEFSADLKNNTPGNSNVRNQYKGTLSRTPLCFHCAKFAIFKAKAFICAHLRTTKHIFLNAPLFVLEEHACSSQDLCANFEAPKTIFCDQKVCCRLSRIFSLFRGLLLVLTVYSCTLQVACVKISFCIFTLAIQRCTFNIFGNIFLHCNWEVHICAFVLGEYTFVFSKKTHLCSWKMYLCVSIFFGAFRRFWWFFESVLLYFQSVFNNFGKFFVGRRFTCAVWKYKFWEIKWFSLVSRKARKIECIFLCISKIHVLSTLKGYFLYFGSFYL